MTLLVAPLALALVIAPAPRCAFRWPARTCTPRCTEGEQPPPQRTYRVAVPAQHTELLAARAKQLTEEQRIRQRKKTHWLVDVPSWSPVAPGRHFEFDHALHLRGWCWILGIVLVNRIILIFRFGAAEGLKKGEDQISSTVEQEAELHEFVCEDCGFTMFPSRGREWKFFGDGFRCPSCGATKEKFFDLTDLNDQRSLQYMEADTDFNYEIEEIRGVAKDLP